MEDGQHQSLIEYKITLDIAVGNLATAHLLGIEGGFVVTMAAVTAKVIEDGELDDADFEEIAKFAEDALCTICPPIGVSAKFETKVSECAKTPILDVGISAGFAFCSVYGDGFKCAMSAVIAVMQKEFPKAEGSFEVKAEIGCKNKSAKIEFEF